MDDQEKPLLIGNLRSDPGLIAEYDQLREQAAGQVRKAEDFFYVATLTTTADGVGLLNSMAFKNVPDGDAAQTVIDVLHLVREAVEKQIANLGDYETS